MHEYCNFLGRHLICSTQICIVGVATSVQMEQGVGMRSRLYVPFSFMPPNPHFCFNYSNCLERIKKDC